MQLSVHFSLYYAGILIVASNFLGKMDYKWNLISLILTHVVPLTVCLNKMSAKPAHHN